MKVPEAQSHTEEACQYCDTFSSFNWGQYRRQEGEEKKRKAVRGRQENRSEGSRIKQDTAPGGEQEQEGTRGEKAKNIKGADAATRQVCELQGERWGGGQTTPSSLDETMRPPESKIFNGRSYGGLIFSNT